MGTTIFKNDFEISGGTLRIGLLGTGSTINNLGVDSNGFVVSAGTIDYYTTGVTLSGTTVIFDRNDLTNAYSVDLSPLIFTGNTSGDCISDIFVSNIHSCSPLSINPNNEGNVYFGSTNGVAIDVVNGKLGIGTGTNPISNPYKLAINNGSIQVTNGGIQANGLGNTARIELQDTQVGGAIIIINPQYSFGRPSIETNGNFPIIFAPNSQERMILTSGGNLGVGVVSPTEKLEVSGKTKTTNLQITSGATDGYVLKSDSLGNASWQPKNPYIEYKALVTQTGVSAPSESILIDTLSGGTWSYVSTGVYYFTSVGSFTNANKVEVYIPGVDVLGYTMSNQPFNIKSASRLDNDTIMIRTGQPYYLSNATGGITVTTDGDITSILKNDILNNTPITIRVWS